MTNPPTAFDLPPEAFRKDRILMLHDVEPKPDRHDTIELRLSRLEAWMRSEIFARTAMDEPEPEPVTAGDAEKWEQVADALAATPYGWATHTMASNIDRSQRAVAEAISIGLAVSPDDPRLQPIVATYDTFEAAYAAWEGAPANITYKPMLDSVVDAVIDHINDRRAPVAKGGEGE